MLSRQVAGFFAAVLLFSPFAGPGAQTPSAVRMVKIDTREGTWMSVDLSPDGSTLLFDMLGDIYSMPATGGEAKRLTSLPKLAAANARPRADHADEAGIQKGQPFDGQPRFSPDGTKIVFISDRDGADNVYIMRADGSDLRQISFGRDMHTSPTWSPDGRSIAVRRVVARPNAFVGSAGQILLYGDDGKATELTKTAETPDVSGMEFSPDGKSIYVAVPVDPVRNEIPHGRTFQVKQLDIKTRALEEVTDNFGGAVRPRVTRDGKLLAYATFDDGQMVLRVRDLAEESERDIARGIEMSAVLAGLQLDALPGYSFTSDGSAVFLSYGGKIHRLSVQDGAVSDVPFHVETTLAVGPTNYFEQTPLEKEMPVRMLNWPNFSRDHSRVVFEAVGKVWVAQGDGARPHRLTTSNTREYAPSVSPDGKWVAYVTWSDSLRGQIFKAPISGGAPIQLTTKAGYYANPNWSADGKRIVAIVGGNAELRGLDPTQDQHRSFAWIDANGGALHTITSSLTSGDRFGGFQDVGAQFNRDGSRIWFVTGDGSQLKSIGVDGADERTHFTIVNAQYQVPTYITVSPDETKVLFTSGNLDLWMMPMPAQSSAAPKVNPRTDSTGLVRVSAPAGYAPRWISDSEISWAFGNKLFRKWTTGSGKPLESKINLTVPVSAGKGTVALVGARIVTMQGDRVIEHGTLVVQDTRIIAAGPVDSVLVPAGARVVHVEGKTIVPGFMDLHDHGFGGSAIHNWPELHRKAAAKLAFGVTLSRDLSAPVQSAFSVSELINSGQTPGPRAYAAGEPVLPAIFEIRTLGDATNVVRMMKDLGSVVLKEYLQPTRYQRQLAGEAARREHLMITAEGGLDFKNNLTMLVDGYTATEHMWAPFPIYGDVGQLMAKTGFFYTPTIGTSAAGSEHWYRTMPVDNDPRQSRFILHTARESLYRRVTLAKIAPEWETVFSAVTTSANRLSKNGARILTGSHDIPTPSGLGLHWEIWSLVEGGMTPLEALRATTTNAAEALGFGKQLGSLEVGKLADLLVLDANPLDKIQNTLGISIVMRNGVMYNPNTLAVIKPN